MEAAHSPDDAARGRLRLAAAELLLSGTTTALTMETVHDTDVVFETLAEIGLRATVGKCMMDSDDNVPARLREQTQASIDESVALAQAMGRRGRRPAARGLRSALCRLVLARAARGGRGAVGARARHRPHARLGVARRSRGRAPALGRTLEPRVPRGDRPRKRSAVRRALRLGQRRPSRRSSRSATSR